MSAVMRVLSRITQMDVQVRCIVRDAYTHYTNQATISNKFDSRYRQMSAVMRVLRRVSTMDVKVRCIVRDAYTHYTNHVTVKMSAVMRVLRRMTMMDVKVKRVLLSFSLSVWPSVLSSIGTSFTDR